MRLVLELGVREPAYGNLWPDHCRELAAWRGVLQGMTEAADRLLATSIQPFLGLAHAFFNAGANFHRFGCWRVAAAQAQPVLAQGGARLLSLPREGSAVAARPERDSAA